MMLSRVADSLYWTSRYLERAEHTARLTDVALDLMPERSPAGVRRSWARLYASVGRGAPDDDVLDALTPADVVRDLAFDDDHPDAIASCIESARENARQVREQISSEMWEQINRLHLRVRDVDPDSVLHTGPHAFFQSVKEGAHLIQGVTDSTMNHGEGWQFIQVGRSIERTALLATLLDAHLDDVAPDCADDTDAYLNLVGVLRSGTAFEAYCKVYTAEPNAAAVAEFLLLNEHFPHSVAFSVGAMSDALGFIADRTDVDKTRPVNRRVGRLRAMLTFDPIDEVLDHGLHDYLRRIRQQCMSIHEALLDTYIHTSAVSRP